MKDFTNGLKIGDVVLTPYKGIFRVVDIQRRFWKEWEVMRYRLTYSNKEIKAGDEYGALVKCVRIANAQGRRINSVKVYDFDALNCTKVTEEYFDRRLKDIENKRLTLLGLMESIKVKESANADETSK